MIGSLAFLNSVVRIALNLRGQSDDFPKYGELGQLVLLSEFFGDYECNQV